MNLRINFFLQKAQSFINAIPLLVDFQGYNQAYKLCLNLRITELGNLFFHVFCFLTPKNVCVTPIKLNYIEMTCI